jgi:hypothetical protein
MIGQTISQYKILMKLGEGGISGFLQGRVVDPLPGLRRWRREVHHNVIAFHNLTIPVGNRIVRASEP